jgi:hypothetical protein
MEEVAAIIPEGGGMTLHNYILDERGQPVLEPDVIKWAQWFETSKRILKQDRIDPILVSTVFLGVDHNFMGEGLPLLWETMIFGGEHDQYQERYTSREEALKGHENALQMVKGQAA